MLLLVTAQPSPEIQKEKKISLTGTSMYVWKIPIGLHLLVVDI